MKTRDVIFLRNIDPTLKRAFKALCAKRGMTMTARIRNMMVEAVREEEPDEIKRMRKLERKTA